MHKLERSTSPALIAGAALLMILAAPTLAEFYWEGVSGGVPCPTGYNQGRKIVRDAENSWLHVTFDNLGGVWYSWSENNGDDWLPGEEHREVIEEMGMTHGYGAIGLDLDHVPCLGRHGRQRQEGRRRRIRLRAEGRD